MHAEPLQGNFTRKVVRSSEKLKLLLVFRGNSCARQNCGLFGTSGDVSSLKVLTLSYTLMEYIVFSKIDHILSCTNQQKSSLILSVSPTNKQMLFLL